MSSANSASPRPPTRRLAWLVVAAITGMLAVASTTTPATGAEAADEEPADGAVASYAADYSVTSQEAQRRLDRIQPLQEILASIRELESARLAGWGIDHTGTFTGWVWLTGNEAPSAAAATIADTHTDVQIRTGATHTRAELLAAQQSLFQDVGPTGQVTDGPETQIQRIVTYTGISMRANAVRIGIDPRRAAATPGGLEDSGPVAMANEALQAKITEATRQLQDHIEVTFKVEDGRGIALDADFKGGQTMGSCTSGFAARKNGRGAYGIITAGHCGDDGPRETQTFRMHSVKLPHKYGWFGVRADAQFHTIPAGSGHMVYDDYLCHSSPPINYCDVTDDVSRSHMVDEYVCHAGRRSGVSCGVVTDIEFGPTGCRNNANTIVTCDNVFIEVYGEDLRGCKGDSGGPWYRNGVAYGIHGGSNGGNNCRLTGRTAYFSAIREVETFLGVQILTSGPVTTT